MIFLDALSSYLDHLAQQRRETAAAQAQQAPAQQFAAAWNCGQLRVPSAYIYSVTDPVTGATAEAAPWCDAAVDDSGCLRLALTVPPDAPIDGEVMAAQTEAVRQLARAFFQVGMRVTGVDAHRQTLQLALAPVRPQVDASGAALLGYDDTGSPVYARLLGEVTAISGADALCLPWLSSSYAAVSQQALDWQTVVSSTRAAIRQAHTGVTQPYLFLDVGDAPCPENSSPERVKNLADSHRGIVMHSRGDTAADGWAIRPTQTLRRDGVMYTLEKSGRTLTFTPAWLY